VPLRYAPPMELSCIPPNVYQFRVVVQGISPLIWRRFSIRSDMSLATLHATLQIIFGWSDVHLHYFRRHCQLIARRCVHRPGRWRIPIGIAAYAAASPVTSCQLWKYWTISWR
jgi:Plasmid pRiA4b ORF-3-like protein